ncbi:RNA polymerase II subunit A C-terminal domain phosphatase SSU72 [Diaphorina citri]|uniref:RNA polymerase II subunit A C-terminal domain phosphatase SSU72 n=1 Tax=Diaphorina citri TaxID=121845 RepID=A0A1S3DU30_DIACI|nr:RNA polymerase II subunit A C-terminal domain phosphatase SSU72 [Diaphorina citri]
MPSNLKVAVVCSSNMNRSMEAHAYLSKKGVDVKSFGTGDKVKLPGTAMDKPNVYDFHTTTYEDIYQDLMNKDKAFYTRNGLLHMLERNKRIKLKPEKFQESKDKFDIIITCEERVYDQVLEHFDNQMISLENTPVHLINIDIQDNQEEATLGAFLASELMSMFIKCEDLDNEIDEIMQEFEEKCSRPLLHTILFY